MAKNKTSALAAAGDGLFGTSDKEQQVQVVHKVQEVQEVRNRPLGTTQGKKGQHAKRINMAFSDENHYYITHESRRRGISATVFVNDIIDEYKREYVEQN